MTLRILKYGGVVWLLGWIFFGCAASYPPVNLNGKGYPDLHDTPFFPQETYQCGPASLAMILKSSGVDVTPQTLVPLTYVPERQGSFQPELLAAARTFGRIPYVIDPNLNALADELLAGRPVLVLQNYGLEKIAAYHYAVVIGLQPDETVILRSGTTKRYTMSIQSFLMSWLRPGAWGMVALRPGELPENADPKRYLQGLATFEDIAGPKAAAPAFEAALSKWPDNTMLLFASGNNALKQNYLAEATTCFKKTLKIAPEHLGALNNLAHTLARQGHLKDAKTTILKAKKLAEQQQTRLKDQIILTEHEIQEMLEKQELVKKCQTKNNY
ncbi:MAG: PA2778 family cysteine peptidase [Desulfobacterales bacterium]|nr:PA2778 family cysteine peptidase [Desulfobacterales bacterium]